MTAPAGVTTVAQAAQFAWDKCNALLPRNTPAASIKQRHFNTRPLADVKAIVLKNQQTLTEFATLWAALQKKNNVKVNAPTAAPAGAKTDAQKIYDDMRDQFTRWNKTCNPKTRGAWWGSKGPGITAGAKTIPQKEIAAIKPLAEKGHWVFKNSFSGDLSWHKRGKDGKTDFIYHTKSP